MLQDCYVDGGGKLPGYTCGVADDSPRRIDYIFNLSPTQKSATSYRNAKVILAEKKEDGLSASDHLGVMVDIDFL